MRMDFLHYLNIRGVIDGSLRADGQRMAFLYNPTGTYQVFTSDAARGWAAQRTFYPNRVMFVQYAPVGNRYIFGMDEGGNEQTQFFLSSDDGQEVVALTNNPEVKHVWGCWNAAATQIAFTATRENNTDFHVYVMDLASREIRKVSDLAGYCYVQDWHEQFLLVAQANGNDDNNLLLVNLESGETKLLTAHVGKAFFSGAKFHNNGSCVWCSSNLEREFSNLARIDLESGVLEFQSDRAWDEESFAFSGDYLCVSSNQAGLSVLELKHQITGEVQVVQGVPVGVAQVLPSLVANTFLVIANGSRAAYNVFILTTDGTLTAWTQADLGLVPQASLVEPKLVKWQSFDGLEISGWYYQPKNVTGKVPVVISIHGGPESQSRPDFMALAQYWVSRGMAVLYPNVRGSTGYGKTFMALDDVRKRMDSVADIRAAVQWLVAEGSADAKRIAVYGGSYGGFMVLSCLTTYPELFAAGVDIVGISNFVTFLERTSAYRRSLRESEYGSLEHDREFLTSISPITHLNKLRAPLFIVHGANDPRVPLFEAEQMRDALIAKGVPVEFLVYADEGHGLAKLHNRLDAYPKIAAFLEQHLQPEVV